MGRPEWEREGFASYATIVQLRGCISWGGFDGKSTADKRNICSDWTVGQRLHITLSRGLFPEQQHMAVPEGG